MKNFDLICIGVVVLIVGAMWWFAKRHPATVIKDRPSPLPSGLYTNGAPTQAQSNDVTDRVNFRQQPVG